LMAADRRTTIDVLKQRTMVRGLGDAHEAHEEEEFDGDGRDGGERADGDGGGVGGRGHEGAQAADAEARPSLRKRRHLLQCSVRVHRPCRHGGATAEGVIDRKLGLRAFRRRMMAAGRSRQKRTMAVMKAHTAHAQA